jgi:hypothetical protein
MVPLRKLHMARLPELPPGPYHDTTSPPCEASGAEEENINIHPRGRPARESGLKLYGTAEETLKLKED